MSDYGDFAQHYNGPAICARTGCDNPARWMPVVEFRASLEAEEVGRSAGICPVALLGLGLCDLHKPEFAVSDVDDGGEQGIHAHARRILRALNKADPDPSRTSVAWAEVARRA